MKWWSSYKHPDNLHFIIRKDSTAGFYMYMYQNPALFEKDMTNPHGCPSHQDDWLQDDLEGAQRCALRIFGVPMDSWGLIE